MAGKVLGAAAGWVVGEWSGIEATSTPFWGSVAIGQQPSSVARCPLWIKQWPAMSSGETNVMPTSPPLHRGGVAVMRHADGTDHEMEPLLTTTSDDDAAEVQPATAPVRAITMIRPSARARRITLIRRSSPLAISIWRTSY